MVISRSSSIKVWRPLVPIVATRRPTLKTGLMAISREQLYRLSSIIFARRPAFIVAAPKVWNDLPVDIRDEGLSIQSFKSKLKTHYFKMAYNQQ